MIPSPTPIAAREALQWLSTDELKIELATRREKRRVFCLQTLIDSGITFEEIRQASVVVTTCADSAGISTDDLLSASRAKKVAFPRQVAMYILRERGYTLVTIRNIFGKRDHGTVCHAADTVKRKMAKSPQLADAVQRLTERVDARLADETESDHQSKLNK